MNRSMSIMRARRDINRLPEFLERHPGVLRITRNGRAVLAVMRFDDYEGLLETMEILADRRLMAQLRKSVAQMKAGQFVPWETVRRKLKSGRR